VPVAHQIIKGTVQQENDGCYNKPLLKVYNLHKVKFNTNTLSFLLHSPDIVNCYTSFLGHIKPSCKLMFHLLQLHFFKARLLGNSSSAEWVSHEVQTCQCWLKQQFHHSGGAANLSSLVAVQQQCFLQGEASWQMIQEYHLLCFSPVWDSQEVLVEAAVSPFR
jgi:hypothetical protein